MAVNPSELMLAWVRIAIIRSYLLFEIVVLFDEYNDVALHPEAFSKFQQKYSIYQPTFGL
jgi:hypothetical protein